MSSVAEKTVFLLPVYKPGEELLDLCRGLSGIRAVIVDCGSGKDYDELLRRASEYGDVLSLPSAGKKRGRGTALKHGLRHILMNAVYTDTEIIVTGELGIPAEDVIRVAEKTAETGGLVVGARKGGASSAAKLGRGLTDLVFRIGAGKGVSDTLSGVRGFTRGQAEAYAELGGDRFEYETNMLLHAAEEKTPMASVDVKGADRNGFRFHPLWDMIRVYWTIFMESRTLKYIFSSGVAFIIDFIIFGILLKVFTVLFGLLPFSIQDWSYLPATICAWIVSSLTNFFMNRSFVFRSDVPIKKALPEYYGLAAVVFLMKTLILTLMIKVLRIPEMIAKLVAEVAFFVSNYFIQKIFIFKKKENK